MSVDFLFFFNDTSTTEIYTYVHTLSLHDALPILLENVIAMLTPGARLVIRTGLVDGSRRSLVSRIGDRAANLVGWMQSSPRCYPDADGLRAILEGAGLQVTTEIGRASCRERECQYV